MAKRRSLDIREEFRPARQGPLVMSAVYEEVLPVRRATGSAVNEIQEEIAHDRCSLRARLVGSAGPTGHD